MSGGPPSNQSGSRRPALDGWINVLMASIAMTATLPGRTHGLGLVTEPLLADLMIDRTLFARINLASSLLGAAFGLPAGYLIDRCGVRVALIVVVTLLALAVFGMGVASGPLTLLLALIFVRGLGQSALSIVSLAIIGKWFSARLGTAMGVFAVLLTFGFIGSILGMGAAVEAWGWRPAWNALGFALLAFVPVGWLFVRNSPAADVSAPEPVADVPADGAAVSVSYRLGEALRTPAFWVVALGTSMFNLVWSAVTLFNESILAERGFDNRLAIEIMAILTGCGLLANLAAGGLATRARIGKLLGVGLLLLAIALAAFPSVDTVGQARLYGVAMGLTGGLVTVVFFAAWRHLFGADHLGRIQSAAQLISVLASASGPLIVAEASAATGSYAAADRP